MSLATTPTRIAGQPWQAGVKLVVFEEPEPAREEGAYVEFVENGQYGHRWVPMTYPVGEPAGEITSLWAVPEETR